MSLIYLLEMEGGDQFVAADWDEVADEATQFVYQNLTDEAWTVRYYWKNNPNEQVRVIPAQTAQSTLGIPPGQRKWLLKDEVGGRERHGYDTEIREFGAHG